ncbi:TPA: NAD(P)-dependent oxidoreductase, partial [Enterococcus faecium]
SNILFTMVGYPKDVEEIYYGQSGIFSADISGHILVDLTTSTPSLAEKIAKTAKEKGADALDAPVSGGDLGAKNGTLTIMVGGEEAVYDQVLPLFKEFGTTFTLHGSAGKGQHTKMANQIMIAGTMTGMTEMLVYAQKNGLDLKKVIETLSGGSAANWSLSNYSPRILKEDYTPGFFVKHFIKDLKIALEEAEKMDLVLPATTQALKLYEELADKGFENDGTQALIKLWWPEGKIPEKKS